MKSFEPEARAAFSFLSGQGYTVASEPAGDAGRRPRSVTLRFRSPKATVETSLILGFAGDDGVQTRLLTITGSTELGPTVVHKGHEMRKALEEHAKAVQAALASQ